MEQGLYVKGGSILPMLLHKRELSLLNAIKNNVGLEIYPDQSNEAMGTLYLDDGDSYAHEKGSFTLVNYYYDSTGLWVEKQTDSEFAPAAIKLITSVVIHGVPKAPTSVRTTTTESIPFTYSDQTLTV